MFVMAKLQWLTSSELPLPLHLDVKEALGSAEGQDGGRLDP